MDLAFKDMTAVGATVVRTWGFNEVVGGPSYDGEIYYQNWVGATPAVNTGSDGLESFGAYAFGLEKRPYPRGR